MLFAALGGKVIDREQSVVLAARNALCGLVVRKRGVYQPRNLSTFVDAIAEGGDLGAVDCVKSSAAVAQSVQPRLKLACVQSLA